MNATVAEFGTQLNAPQRQGATFGVGESGSGATPPLLIIAGAGTGKTNTLAHRVAWLLLSGVPAEQIALMTFTRRAAQEMVARAERIATAEFERRRKHGASIPQNVTRSMWSGTFHSIGNRLLREYAHVLGLDPAFSILDRGDAADLMDLERQRLGLGQKQKRFPRKDTCLSIYSHRVNTRRPLADTLDREYPWCEPWHDELRDLFKGYVVAKQAQQVLDYDDLLLYWHLLVQEPSVAAEIGARFTHVLVDEYQDTNALQAEILLSIKPDGQGLCVVGDDAQSIYSFRAANVENILTFPQRFKPAANVVVLEDNYRSVQPVLDSANALMSSATHQYQKSLRASRGSGQRPFYVTVEDDRGQADYVVNEILRTREEGNLLRDQAVLMRNSHDSDALELELVRRDIPYVKYGGLKFLEAAHVKDALAILRLVDNPRNRLAGFRTLQLLPGIGPATAERALDWLEQRGSLQDLKLFEVPAAAREDWPTMCALLEDLAAAEHWPGQMTCVREWYTPHIERIHGQWQVRAGDIEQLEALSSQFENRERFLSELTLDPPNASGDQSGPPHQDEDYLVLSTVHSAKGQEWNSVYLLNVADGNFPSEFATGKPEQIEEERRLLYVAMTRARSELHLIAPLRYYITQQRRYGERHVYGARSRFMDEAVLETMEPRAWPVAGSRVATEPARTAVRIDAASRMRDMWE